MFIRLDWTLALAAFIQQPFEFAILALEEGADQFLVNILSSCGFLVSFSFFNSRHMIFSALFSSSKHTFINVSTIIDSRPIPYM